MDNLCLRHWFCFTRLVFMATLSSLSVLLSHSTFSLATALSTRGLHPWPKLQVYQDGYALTKTGPFLVDHREPVRTSARSCITLSNRRRVPGFYGSQDTFQVGSCTLLTQNISIIRKGLQSDVLAAMTCEEAQQCIPVETEAEDAITPLGIFNYVRITRCGCVNRQQFPSNLAEKRPKQGCHLTSSHQTFFAGTRFERTINVGVCSGGVCSGNDSCAPVQFKAKAIPGPNGRVQVDIITKCGCAGSCYRAVSKKVFALTRRNKRRPRQKVIDVGQCISPFHARPPTPCSAITDSKHTQDELRSSRQCDQTNNQERVCQVTRTKSHHIKLANRRATSVTEIVACGWTQS